MSNKELPPHPQADTLIAYAKGKEIQGRLLGRKWKTVAGPLDLVDDSSWELRVKTEMMVLAGHEFPMPAQEPLNEGQVYWTPRLHAYEEMCEADEWTGHKADLGNLKRNIIHLTREGAIAQAKAMIAACGGEV